MAKTTKKIETEVKETEVNDVTELKDFKKITLDEFKEKVTIKPISTFIARDIADLLYTNCVIKDNYDTFYIDRIMYDVVLDFSLIYLTTDFYNVVENSALYIYEDFKTIGICDYVFSRTDEYLIYRIEQEIEDRVKNANSIGASLSRCVDKLVDKIPDTKEVSKFINNIPKVLNKIDPKIINAFSIDKNSGVINKDVNVVDIVNELKNKSIEEK